MKKTICLIALVTFGLSAWGAPRIVLYSQGFAFVEETREFVLEPHGTLVLEGLPRAWMPDSLTAEGLSLLRVRPLIAGERLAEPAGPDDRRGIPLGPADLRGQLVEVVSRGERFFGRLLAVGDVVVLSTLDGVVMLPEYDHLTVPHPMGAAAEVEYRAQAGPSNIVLRYLTQGMQWNARYAAILGEQGLELVCWAQLANTTGLSFTQARVELVAGDVGAPRPADIAYRTPTGLGLAMVEADIAPAAEYHTYKLPQPVDLLEGTTHVPLVSGELAYDRLYRFRGGPVQAIVTFENDLAPLPAGEVRVFDEGGDLFVGASSVRHTPVGEQVELILGAAFDLTGERIHLRRERPTAELYRDTYRITLRSAKDVDVVVEVLEGMRGTWEIVRANHPFSTVAAQEVRFDLAVPAGGAVELEYTVEWRP